MLSLLYIYHTQIVTIHYFVCFSVTTPSQGSCEKHCRIHPRCLLRSVSMLGKKESYREVQNCIGRTLQHISLSILLFTQLFNNASMK